MDSDSSGPIIGMLTRARGHFGGGEPGGRASGYLATSQRTERQLGFGQRRGGLGRDIHSQPHIWQRRLWKTTVRVSTAEVSIARKYPLKDSGESRQNLSPKIAPGDSNVGSTPPKCRSRENPKW